MNKDKKSPKVSIVFSNFNGGKEPINCLNSIRRLNYPQSSLEVIVIDNHSTDGSYQAIKNSFSFAKVLRQKKNLGFAKAINLGVKIAKGDFIFITNDDIIFEKNSLKTLTDFALKHNDCIIGGKQVHSQTKKFIAGGRKFSLWTGMQTNIKTRSPVICDQVDGCAMLIPRKVIKDIGLFDERFFPVYGEDLDFCLRVKKAGFKVIYLPKAIFYHKLSQSVSKLAINKIYYFGFKNRLRVIFKHGKIYQIISFLLIHYFMTMPFRIIFREEPILIPDIKALVWNLKNLNKTASHR